jgi:chemotaxis regulatin CheY-phosphate phosphatase CheZ
VRNRSTGLCGEFGLNLLTKMWDTWLEQMESQVACGRVILQNQQYLADVFEDIKNTKKELFNRV